MNGMRGLGRVLSLALLTLVGACSAPTAEPTTSGTPTASAETELTAVEEAWRLPLRPLTQPVIAEGTAVLLAADRGDLYVVGVDPRTGRSEERRVGKECRSRW